MRYVDIYKQVVYMPFCPTRDKLSDKQQDKLLQLYMTKRYVIHYRNLQQCMRHVIFM